MIRTLAAMLALIAGLAGTATAQPVAPLAARFSEPTDRYPHDVLGHLPGFGALEVKLTGGETLRLVLPESRVFEDVAPRL